ncbi:MAG TPA: alanyl-tRNA editing protein [Vicinamibacterales bacterium]|nr:alanyl-tRNA editing protein [Vicinamibacterales bacterium]
MTDRLYYADPYLREFDARIERLESRGGRTVVTLDRTAFYPTSGGQPFDTGTLGPFRIVEVGDEDDGTVAHVVEPEPEPEPRTQNRNSEPRTSNPEPGTVVHGAVDWPRRFDHMQQHTGQHVLSAAFERLFKIRTVSFHLGSDVSTIDLGREALPDEIGAAEQEANRVVWEDRPVSIRFASAEEAATLPLRKEPARGGLLRLIEVADFDLSACGGTHVARTGAIGVIAVSRWERFKGGQRLEFVCGGRALRAFRVLRDAVTASSRLLSALPEELPAAIERLQLDAKEQKRTLSAQQLELARYRAEEIAAGAEPTAAGQLVVRVLDADANALKAMAAAIASRPGFVVALFSSSSPTLAVIARSEGVNVSAQQILAALVARFGGRGGGRPELAQGGGLVGPPEDIMSAVRDVVSAAA